MRKEQLLILASTYCHHTGKKLSTIGQYAARDGKFFLRLEAGAGCTLKTAENIVRWFSDAWPEDLEWPQSIPRPAPSDEDGA